MMRSCVQLYCHSTWGACQHLPALDAHGRHISVWLSQRNEADLEGANVAARAANLKG